MSETKEITRGAGGPSVTLDMTKGKDREYVRTAVASGWGVTAADLKTYKQGLDEAISLARTAKDSREINSCVKTMAVIVGQMQADEHLDAKVEAQAKVGNTFNINGPAVIQVAGECWGKA